MTLHPSCPHNCPHNCPRRMGDECESCLDPAYQWRNGECWVLANLRRAGKSDKEIEAEIRRYAGLQV